PELIALAFSPGGKRFLAADRGIQLFNAKGSLLASWAGHEETIEELAFRPDGKRFASRDRANDVKIWDAAAPEDRWSPAQTAAGLNDFAYAPDGKFLIIARSVPSGDPRAEGPWEARVEI